jgi:hypothetical protein
MRYLAQLQLFVRHLALIYIMADGGQIIPRSDGCTTLELVPRSDALHRGQ